MSGYKENKRSLTFLSAKAFLDSVGTQFEYRFAKLDNREKLVFQYRPVGTEEWLQKYIHIVIHHYNIDAHPVKAGYCLNASPFCPPEAVDDEGKYLLDMNDFLNHRVLDVTLNTRQPVERPLQNVADLMLYAPMNFDRKNISVVQNKPGLLTIRIDNGWTLDAGANTYFYGAFLKFNAWKHLDGTMTARPKLQKRKLEEALPTPTPETETQVAVEDIPESKSAKI